MRKIKLLLVDDMEWVYELAKLKLRNKYTIDYARNERQALRMIKENNYKLVVADYYLGRTSPTGGLKVIRVAREIGLPAILMSKENHRKEALQEGAKFMFKKNLPRL